MLNVLNCFLASQLWRTVQELGGRNLNPLSSYYIFTLIIPVFNCNARIKDATAGL